MQQIIHYFLHFGFPLVIASIFFKKAWLKTYIIFLATMLVDLDHLLAVPIFDPCRCSIGFHPLHSYTACAIYIAGLFIPKTRAIALGLCMHMLTDGIDCQFSIARCN